MKTEETVTDGDLRYVPVAAALPVQLPALDRKHSIRYARNLVRHFGRLGLGSPNQVRAASLGDWGISGGRRVWVSARPTPSSNHHKGWGRLIHDCSHLVFRRRHPTFRPHDGGHATLEAEMAAYAKARGWLDLAAAPKHVEKPTLISVRLGKLAGIDAKEKRWVSKLRRADTALRKLRRQRAYYQRSVGPR